jgi:hypothetical protein
MPTPAPLRTAEDNRVPNADRRVAVRQWSDWESKVSIRRKQPAPQTRHEKPTAPLKRYGSKQQKNAFDETDHARPAHPRLDRLRQEDVRNSGAQEQQGDTIYENRLVAYSSPSARLLIGNSCL